MAWQTLADLARNAAALPKTSFKDKYPAPFLLEVDSEAGDLTTVETRDFNPEQVVQGDLSPSLQKSRIFYFGDGQTFVIGRDAGCDIPSNKETVSERHCSFESFGSIWAIKDVGSRNGTWLNGKKLNAEEQSPIKYESKIMLGEAQFLFLGSEHAFELVQELSKEPRIRPRSMGKYRSEFADIGSPEEARQKFPGPFLVVQAPKGRDATNKAVSSNTITLSQEELKKSVNKNVTDAVFDLSNHSLVRVGRATVTQIHLPLGAISNLHAALVKSETGNWFIQDMGAKNGTYLWGDRLENKKDIESGTEITFGNIKSIFFNTEDLVTYALHRDTLV